MMNENDVVTAMENHLASRNYKLFKKCTTTMRGIDLIMKSESCDIYIEAKGKTSSKKSSKRYGKVFTDAQCHDHISRAVFKACQTRDEHRSQSNARIAIALAHTKDYQKYYERIKSTMKDLCIGVFWIKDDGRVELAENWEY